MNCIFICEALEQHLLDSLTESATRDIRSMGHEGSADSLKDMYNTTGNEAFLTLLEKLAKEEK